MPTEDVIVIGGGIIGASIAWRLAQAGLRVTILEADRLGGEASTAGAGMLAPGGELDGDSPFGRLLLESARLYPHFVSELSRASGIRIDYQRCGGIEIAYDSEHWSSLLERNERQRALGIHSELLASAKLPGHINQDDMRGAIQYREDAIVNPHQVMQALRRILLSRSQLRERTRAETLQLEGNGVRVNGELARSAVLAGGAWSGQLASAALPLPTSVPVRGHLLGYQLPPGTIGSIVRHQHTYILQRSSGLAIAGSSTENAGFDRQVDERIVQDIQQRAERLVPLLKEFDLAGAWNGLRPAIEDGGEPVHRRYEDSRLWCAYGHYRNGILAAPAVAAAISAEIIATLETD